MSETGHGKLKSSNSRRMYIVMENGYSFSWAPTLSYKLPFASLLCTRQLLYDSLDYFIKNFFFQA
jgi:hypothetical protein